MVKSRLSDSLNTGLLPVSSTYCPSVCHLQAARGLPFNNPVVKVHTGRVASHVHAPFNAGFQGISWFTWGRSLSRVNAAFLLSLRCRMRSTFSPIGFDTP